MKTILRIGDRSFAMPMKKAVQVIECMGSAIPVNRDYVHRHLKDGSADYRDHYVASVRDCFCSIEQVADDQIHIAEGAPTDPGTKKSRKALPAPPVRQLGFGGVA